MHYISIVFFIAISLFFVPCQTAGDTINVGGYIFPPFLEKNEGEYSGLTIDLIDAMNQSQDSHHFQFIRTSSMRRYKDFQENKFDMIVFESIQWGWQDQEVTDSIVFLEGGEVYITKADSKKNQTYFDHFKGKSLLGYLGYHYGFANFNSDREILKKKFNAKMTTTHTGNILSIIEERADIAVVTNSFLDKFFLENPDLRKKILISEKFDQKYHHTVLIRKNFHFSVQQINQLLLDMKKKGVLDALWQKYGINNYRIDN